MVGNFQRSTDMIDETCCKRVLFAQKMLVNIQVKFTEEMDRAQLLTEEGCLLPPTFSSFLCLQL